MNNLSPSDKPEQTETVEEKKMKPDDKIKPKSKQDEAAEKASVPSNNNESGNCYWWLSIINLAGNIFPLCNTVTYNRMYLQRQGEKSEHCGVTLR